MILKEVHIPRTDGFDLARLSDYHVLLREKVFPAISRIEALASFLGYGFLTHSQLDLRMWFTDAVDLAEVDAILEANDLPRVHGDYNPAEEGGEREILLKILYHNAELIRALVMKPNARSIDEVVHWVLNSFGFHNLSEAQWHLRRAGESYSVVIAQLGGQGA